MSRRGELGPQRIADPVRVQPRDELVVLRGFLRRRAADPRRCELERRAEAAMVDDRLHNRVLAFRRMQVVRLEPLLDEMLVDRELRRHAHSVHDRMRTEELELARRIDVSPSPEEGEQGV